jgi:hypothetical protein
MTIIETAKLSGLNPEAYLADVRIIRTSAWTTSCPGTGSR